MPAAGCAYESTVPLRSWRTFSGDSYFRRYSKGKVLVLVCGDPQHVCLRHSCSLTALKNLPRSVPCATCSGQTRLRTSGVRRTRLSTFRTILSGAAPTSSPTQRAATSFGRTICLASSGPTRHRMRGELEETGVGEGIIPYFNGYILQLSHVPQESGDRLPFPDHYFLRAQLFGRVQQQGGRAQVREQCDEHPPVQLQPASILAAKLHGCFHLELTLRWRER